MKNTLLFLAIVSAGLPNTSILAQGRFQLDEWSLPVFQSVEGHIRPDTFYLDFNLYENKGTQNERRIRNLRINDDIDFTLEERVGDNFVLPPAYVPGSLHYLTPDGGRTIIPEDITVSLLVDRSGSIKPSEMEQIRNAVEAFVNVLPEGSLFLSYFHNHISPSYQLSRATFHEAADTLLTRTPWHTDLYNATITKLLEFDSLAVIPNQSNDERYGYSRNNELARRGTRNNYLIVLTDGENDFGAGYDYPNPKYFPLTPGMNVFNEFDVYRKIADYRDKITVFTLGFGAESADFNPEILQNMVNASGNPDGYFYVEPAKILELLETELPDLLRPDYRAFFVNPPGKTFMGEERQLRITLNDPNAGINASTILTYGLGSIANPIVVEGVDDVWQTILWGLLTGVILILVVLIIIQLIWPLINNKLFNSRYKKRYRPALGEARRSCPYCLDPIVENEFVIARCEHIVHANCWINNEHTCPEYGQNCSIGKQNFFDINDPFSRKNKIFYLDWVLFGLIGGFLAWISYMLIKDYFILNEIASALISWFPVGSENAGLNFIQKLSPLFAIGTLMGFFLSILFAHAEEYRSLSILIFFQYLLRGILGAVIGFLSFLIGSIILIQLNVPFTNILFDWIPWLFFGALIGLSLSLKSTIEWGHGLMGGLISIIFSFIVLYTIAGNLGLLALTISFMIYGAGLGASIATVRSTAEKYFVRILNGPKEGISIAVHKWMKAQGDLNEVYIGSSNACEIQLNWESPEEVAEKHAKMYVNKERKIPVLVSLEKGKTTVYDQRFEMIPGKEYDLLNGTTFSIGETVFQYYEVSSN